MNPSSAQEGSVWAYAIQTPAGVVPLTEEEGEAFLEGINQALPYFESGSRAHQGVGRKLMSLITRTKQTKQQQVSST